eukprot:CAMPEP_0170557080 /NCGR_PEP_ID=MMETSP0211-20121228/19184_1 /TAXON_ID=311385 /ORGANISM="Pseudokeronopsis sp., Strain OXSARD2" /LENGTH=91 /DNA_ID=CAMNT_0010867787 /DNA_START=588 /DNA_END=860 /DNA_ORIENTATION=+
MGNDYFSGQAMYSASKIFLDYFTHSLACETQNDQRKIDVLLYKPSFVATKASGKKEKFPVISARKSAEVSLNDLGRTTYTSGVLIHAFIGW